MEKYLWKILEGDTVLLFLPSHCRKENGSLRFDPCVTAFVAAPTAPSSIMSLDIDVFGNPRGGSSQLACKTYNI